MTSKFKHEISKKAYHGKTDKVKYLLSRGEDPNAIEEKGWTPLLLASQEGHISTVELLIQNGADVNQSNSHGETPLLLACKKGFLSTVNELLKHKADMSRQRSGGCTALMLASVRGLRDIAEILLKQGSCVNQKNKDGSTALSLAASKNHLDVVKLLLHYNADIQTADVKGHNALVSAARKGYAEIVRLLLKQGIEIGESLIFASRHGHAECVRVLCESNSDVNKVDGNGVSSLMLAAVHGYYEIALILIDSGIEVSMVDSKGWSALMFASASGNLDILKLLLEKNADANQVNQSGWGPLACLNGHDYIVDRLLKHGADVDAVDPEGWTPLMVAAQIKKPSIINVMESLIQNEANVNLKNSMGFTALQIAVLHSRIDNVKFLLQQGSVNNGTDTLAIALLHKEKAILQDLPEELRNLYAHFRKVSKTEDQDLTELILQNLLATSEKPLLALGSKDNQGVNFNHDIKTCMLQEAESFLRLNGSCFIQLIECLRQSPIILNISYVNSIKAENVKNIIAQNAGIVASDGSPVSITYNNVSRSRCDLSNDQGMSAEGPSDIDD